ncbi:MAG: hypothetical protein HUU02_13630 [Bacteroidetes bacterium]|nr:hypothetical protein [Bacteroidota bacterium]
MIRRIRLMLTVFCSSLVLGYAIIYVVIDEQFESTAVIIPAETDGMGGMGSMLKGLKNLPVNIGKTGAKSETNRYKTIIYSRTMLEELIHQFHLYEVYDIDTTDIDYREKTLKELRGDIVTEETDEDAFEITVRSTDPQRAAAMVNYIVAALNDKVIQLQISKSKENRIFLEKRVSEISKELAVAEDSLRHYQERSGLYDLETQLPGLMTLYGTLESNLMTKKIQKDILEKLYDKNSPEVKSLQIEVSEYQSKLNSLRQQGEKGSLMLSMKRLPANALEYLRRYRTVEISASLLEFVTPLYEQARIEEKKDYPILQVIDTAVPAAKKSWPPRLLFAFLCASFVTSITMLGMVLGMIIDTSTNPKITSLKAEFAKVSFRWK